MKTKSLLLILKTDTLVSLPETLKANPSAQRQSLKTEYKVSQNTLPWYCRTKNHKKFHTRINVVILIAHGLVKKTGVMKGRYF